MRVLIAVTHLLGAGHLTRAAALARAFARAGHETTLVSGGRATPHVRFEGVRLVQLPPVQVAGTDFTTLLDERGLPADASRLTARLGLMLASLERVRPDVVITELFPFGRRALAGEFLALVEHACTMQPRPLIASSVRDILVASAKPQRIAETHARLEALYDAVLVHGDSKFISLDASWPVDGALRRLIRYTGYVDDAATASAGNTCGETGEIIVSGGSSAASLPLYRAALGAAALVPGHCWRVLVGNGVAEPSFAALVSAAPRNAVIERARSDFRALLQSARLSVSQAGYNTVVDLLRAGVRAVLVPFEAGRESEQRRRAERLAAFGLACVLPERLLSAAALAHHIADELDRPRPPAPTVRLDGADRTVAIVEALARERLGKAPRPVRATREDA